MKRFVSIFSFFICFAILWACTKPISTLENDVYKSFDFEDCLSSLDSGENGKLLIGTTNGNLIVFNPKNAERLSWQVGEEQVYCAFQDTSGLFVGVRNEGLRFFRHNDYTSPKRFVFSVKDTLYSVYKIEKYGERLFCATSNGIGFLDLGQKGTDSLTLCYPYADRAPEDFKINVLKCIGDTLYAASTADDNSKFLAFHITENGLTPIPKTQPEKNIKNFFASPDLDNNTLCVIRQDYVVIGNDSFPNNEESFKSFYYCKTADCPYVYSSGERLVVSEQFYPSKSPRAYQLIMPGISHTETANMLYLNGYIYWISDRTLCAIPNHCSQGIVMTAMVNADNKILAVDEENRVYEKDGDGFKYVYSMKGLGKKKVEQVEMLSGKSLCVFSDGKIYIGSKGNSFKDIGEKCLKLKKNNFHRIFYDTLGLYMAHRHGLSFCRVKNGTIDTNSLCEDTSMLSVQCMARIDSDEVYIGTLNHGCLKVKMTAGKMSVVDTVNNYYNIINILKNENDFYYLTMSHLYGPCDSAVDIRNLYLQRIFIYKDSLLIGVSKTGGLYCFNKQNLTQYPGNPILPDINFYPYAIGLYDSILIAGTNIGLIRVNLNQAEMVKLIDVKESVMSSVGSFIRERVEDIVHFGIPAAIMLLLVLLGLVVLIYRFNQQRKELSTSIKDLEDKIVEQKNEITERNNVIKDDRNHEIELLEQNFMMNIKPFNVDHIDREVLSRYHVQSGVVMEKINSLKSQIIDLPSVEFGKELAMVKKVLISKELFVSALDMEMENLHEWYEQNMLLNNRQKLEEFRRSIEDISKKYIDKIVDCTMEFRNNAPKDESDHQNNGDLNQKKSNQNDKKQYYLDIWTICLFIDKTGADESLIANKTLSDILEPDCYSDDIKVKSGYIATLKKEMRNYLDTKTFKCKNNTYSDIYDVFACSLKKILGKRKEYKANKESNKK